MCEIGFFIAGIIIAVSALACAGYEVRKFICK